MSIFRDLRATAVVSILLLAGVVLVVRTEGWSMDAAFLFWAAFSVTIGRMAYLLLTGPRSPLATHRAGMDSARARRLAEIAYFETFLLTCMSWTFFDPAPRFDPTWYYVATPIAFFAFANFGVSLYLWSGAAWRGPLSTPGDYMGDVVWLAGELLRRRG